MAKDFRGRFLRANGSIYGLMIALAMQFTTVGFTQDASVDVSTGKVTRVIGNAISYIPSADTITTLAHARRLFHQGYFIPSSNPDLNLGIAKDNYWVRFSLRNLSASKEIIVVLENPRLNDVEIFSILGDTIASYYELGDNLPFKERVINFNQFAFPVSMDEGTSVEVFLYIRHKGNTLQMPVTAMDNHTFVGRIETGYLISGVSTGIFCITFFFGIFFLFNTRDPLFIYYSGYILSAGIWLWATEGFGFQYLWPDNPEWATRLGPGISAVSGSFFMANCLQFCKPYDSGSLFRKLLIIILVILVMWTLMPFIPFIPITESTMAVFLSVYFTLNIVVAIALSAYLIFLSAKGNMIVLYYFSAVAVTILCSFLIVLRGSGIINLAISSGELMSAGYVVEIILMTAGITKQFYRYKKEREDALLINIEQQKSITQKIVDTIELERKRIGRELHDDIGSGLTQIALMSEAAKQYTSAGSGDVKELNDIATTTRNLVNSIGEIIWALNPENKTVGRLLIYIRDQLNRLLEYSAMEYSIQFPTNESSLELSNIQLRNILMITKEVVHNAVKHSQARHISISCRHSTSSLDFEITDDGVGMEIGKVKLRNGLKNMRLRAAEIGATLSIESIPGAGTVCRYQIPCGSTT